MLHEASITMPRRGNDGQDNGEVIRMLSHDMVRSFGGVSMIPVEGIWEEPETHTFYHDQNVRLVSAVDRRMEHDAIIGRLAIKYGKIAGQLSVYVTHSDGTAEVIEVQPAMAS